jgi:AraC-like DNA-binding protein
VTFQDLVTAARQELALHYLQDPDIPLTEIAHCLGYSELSAFSRAFRAWTGMSPQRYRRSGGAA